MTQYFSDAELACKCGCGLLPPPAHRAKLERLRERYGKPLRVASGARCPKHNAAVSSTGLTGPHTKGATDLAVAGADALHLVDLALEQGFTGIGISQKGPHGSRFVHLDDLPDAPGQPRPTIWSY